MNLLTHIQAKLTHLKHPIQRKKKKGKKNSYIIPASGVHVYGGFFFSILAASIPVMKVSSKYSVILSQKLTLKSKS